MSWYDTKSDGDTLTAANFYNALIAAIRNPVKTVEAHTVSDTLTAAESGTAHTNLGCGATVVTLTLPQSPASGTFFDFVVMVATALRLEPGAAGGIYFNGAKNTDDKYIWADAIGESVRLVADGNGDWVAMFLVGTWTSE